MIMGKLTFKTFKKLLEPDLSLSKEFQKERDRSLKKWFKTWSINLDLFKRIISYLKALDF